MTGDFSFPDAPLCVVGNINRDVKVQEIGDAQGLMRDGETSVSGIVETVGGGGANSACAAAALGAQVRFVGKVGTDPLAERLRQALADQGVRTYLACDPCRATGTTVALGFASGHRHFLSCLPNNESLAWDDIDLAALDGCAHLLRADVWFSLAMLEEGNQRLLAEARRRHVTTSLDINFDPCWRTASTSEIQHRKHLLRKILSLIDVAHGNVSELCEFTDSANLEISLQRLAEWGVKSVTVHMGAEGAGYYTDGELTVEPPDLAGAPLHSTGTGDVLSMCMILLHARQDLSIRQKLQLSNRVVCEFMEGQRNLIPAI
ncbi:MAG: carbohydrate kinase family protein [Pirellulaceae bacterium]